MNCLTDPVAMPDGYLRFTLHGPPGGTNIVERSTNLVHWTPLAVLTPFSGMEVLIDSNAADSARFYRTVGMP